MTWTLARARRAAADVRVAPFGPEVIAAIRPRGVVGMARTRVTGQARALILVVTAGERDAVLGAVRDRTGRDAVTDQAGQLMIYTLGNG